MNSSHTIIAHRGASGYAPENTLAAFRKAHALGAKSIAFDVVLSREGTPVVFHDASTTRTTDQAGRFITKLSLADIKQLNAGSWFSPEFKDEKIPTLAEALLFLREHKMQACIRLKPARGREHFTAMQVVKELEYSGSIEAQSLPLIASLNSKTLLSLRQAHADLPLALICKRWRSPYKQLLDELKCNAIYINAVYLTATHASIIKSLGYDIFCYTVDDRLQAQRLFRLGVSGIFTNYPDKFKEL
jgi:glycerophosphoryl diester phosphodiesterase